jgi:hypothetical protein
MEHPAMDINELISEIEVNQDQAVTRKERATAKVETILAAAQADGRASLTDSEEEACDLAFKTRDRAKDDIKGLALKMERAQNVKKEEQETALALRERSGEKSSTDARPAYDRVARVGRESRTYNKGNCGEGGPFLRDVIDQFLYRDLSAEQRLNQHMAEERVERGQYMERAGETLTSNWTGLTVPQYLTDMYAPAIAGLRPFADICNKHQLPANGMSVNISQVTTASSVALQGTELTAVSATSTDDTLLTENVQTAAGQQTLSRQAIDRGTGIEGIVMDDLFRRYATTLDKTLITQGTTGLSAVATSTAFTTGSPTFLGSGTAANNLYPKILGAAAGVEAALLAYGQPTHAIMHSRRWYWLSSQSSASWPSVSQPFLDVRVGGDNNGSTYNSGIRGRLPNGLEVIVDNNIATNVGTGTNEDEIYIVPSSECHLWEDPQAPVFLRAEQAAAANLGVLLVLYGYFAYSFRRYANAIGKVNGTGNVTPVF